MISGITKVRCITSSIRYNKNQIYTYLKHGKSIIGPGIVTVEAGNYVIQHEDYKEINVTNIELKSLLSQEEF